MRLGDLDIPSFLLLAIPAFPASLTWSAWFWSWTTAFERLFTLEFRQRVQRNTETFTDPLRHFQTRKVFAMPEQPGMLLGDVQASAQV